jgi:hypothetical protein
MVSTNLQLLVSNGCNSENGDNDDLNRKIKDETSQNFDDQIDGVGGSTSESSTSPPSSIDLTDRFKYKVMKKNALILLFMLCISNNFSNIIFSMALHLLHIYQGERAYGDFREYIEFSYALNLMDILNADVRILCSNLFMFPKF